MIRATSLRRWPRDVARRDLVAGLTTAVMLVPQAMAYAMLAGLPPIVGLLASTVPLLAYAAFGRSAVLAVGPVAMVSMLVATTLTPLADPGGAHYIALAAALALLVGLIQVGSAWARAGRWLAYLDPAVLSGFTSAAAIIIGLSQLPALLGIPRPSGHGVGALQAIHGPTAIVGLLSVAALVVMHRYTPRVPRGLVLTTAATVAVAWLGLDERGVAIIGAIPAGLPRPSLPSLDPAVLPRLLPSALMIAAVGSLESVSVAKVFAQRSGQPLALDRELRGLGAANLAAAFFGGYPVTGGLSRTAVQAQAGARSTMAGVITALTVVLTLAALTDLLWFLPTAALAALIVTAVAHLVDIREIRRLSANDRPGLLRLLLTAAATLGLGIEAGLLVGVGLSVVSTLATTRT